MKKNSGLFNNCELTERYHYYNPNIDLHGCIRGTAFYYLVIKIQEMKNTQLEKLYVCHGKGNHNDSRLDGSVFLPLRDEVLPKLVSIMEGRVRLERLKHVSFACLKIRPVFPLSRDLLDTNNHFIDIDKLDTLSTGQILQVINYYVSNGYQRGQDREFDVFMDVLEQKLADRHRKPKLTAEVVLPEGPSVSSLAQTKACADLSEEPVDLQIAQRSTLLSGLGDVPPESDLNIAERSTLLSELGDAPMQVTKQVIPVEPKALSKATPLLKSGDETIGNDSKLSAVTFFSASNPAADDEWMPWYMTHKNKRNSPSKEYYAQTSPSKFC